MKKYLRLIGYVRPHLTGLVMAFAAMLLLALVGSVPLFGMIIPLVDTVLAGKPIVVPHEQSLPFFLQDIVHRVNAMSRLDLLRLIVLWGVIVTLLRSVLQYLQTYFMNDVAQKVIRDMRDAIYAKIVGLPLSFFNKSQTGALVSRITYDTVVIRDAISEGLTDVLFQPVQIVVYTVLLLAVRHVFAIPWSLVLVIFVLLPLIVYPVLKIGRRLKKISHAAQGQIAHIHSTLY